MSSDSSPGLRPELLDDFYAECDELLTSTRAALLLLENNLGKPQLIQTQVETVFRNIHSIKGNSAIVGLRRAEDLAHAMEDLLRALAKKKTVLTAGMVDALLGGAQRLEQIVASHRLGKPLPDIADRLAQLRLHEGSGPVPATVAAAVEGAALPVSDTAEGEPLSPGEAALARGLALWHCTFTPQPALDQRGVNVASVRTRLGALGEIVRATPTVRGKGLVFEFEVALRAPPADLAAWEADGLHFEPPASVVPSAAAETSPSPPSTAEGGEGVSGDDLTLTPSHVVRVDLARLDDLMRILGELVIQRSRLEDRINQVAGDRAPLKEVNLGLARSLRAMREALSRVRLVPIGEIFTRIPLVVRELVRDSDKQVRVVLDGHQTVVDKYLVERLKEPLLHLVRNSFAHGIEPAAARVAAGKPAEATIALRATSEGNFVAIRVRDDGRGVDAAAVAARAQALGLAVPARLAGDALLGVLCLPGFSTREEADRAAGRGVGMAVVANAVRELGGRLSMETWPGAGTEFTLRLPLTLSIVEALIATVGDQLCAVPQAAVDEIIQVSKDSIRTIRQTEVIPYRGGLLPVAWLRRIYRLEEAATDPLTVMVLSGERGATGLVVDSVRMQREVVVRPLLDPLLRVPGFAGATELGDGRPILILDPVSITSGVVRPPEADQPDPDSAVPRRAS